MIILACSIGNADQLWYMLSYGNQGGENQREMSWRLSITLNQMATTARPKQDSIIIHLKYT